MSEQDPNKGEMPPVISWIVWATTNMRRHPYLAMLTLLIAICTVYVLLKPMIDSDEVDSTNRHSIVIAMEMAHDITDHWVQAGQNGVLNLHAQRKLLHPPGLTDAEKIAASDCSLLLVRWEDYSSDLDKGVAAGPALEQVTQATNALFASASTIDGLSEVVELFKETKRQVATSRRHIDD